MVFLRVSWCGEQMDLPGIRAGRRPPGLTVFFQIFTMILLLPAEHAGIVREQFAMMRGVRQGPASGYLFTMAFDPVYRWLMSAVLPPRTSPTVVSSRMCFCIR